MVYRSQQNGTRCVGDRGKTDSRDISRNGVAYFFSVMGISGPDSAPLWSELDEEERKDFSRDASALLEERSAGAQCAKNIARENPIGPYGSYEEGSPHARQRNIRLNIAKSTRITGNARNRILEAGSGISRRCAYRSRRHVWSRSIAVSREKDRAAQLLRVKNAMGRATGKWGYCRFSTCPTCVGISMGGSTDLHAASIQSLAVAYGCEFH